MLALPTLRSSVWILMAVLGGAACSASDVKERDPGDLGGSGNGSGGTSVIGTGGTAGNGSGTGGTTSIDPGTIGPGRADAGSCKQFDVTFAPKIPTVFVLVDRSGSMFAPPAPAWEPLKAGVLKVIQDVQKDVRFGFGAFTGEIGQTCPMFDKVDADLNNFAKISGVYGTLKAPVKGETPTAQVLAQVGEILKKDTTDGPKTILFVTDGEPDYCDDGNTTCPVDSVIYRLQELNKAGINTVVFGLVASSVATVKPETLQAFANAGAGQNVQALVNGVISTPRTVYDQCQGVPGWLAESAAVPRAAMTPLGTYLGAGGTARVYKPDPAQQDALAKDLIAAVSSTKSCVFDIDSKLQVDVNRLSEAKVFIEGQLIPLNDGWKMNSPTQLELVGAACTTWRQPQSTHFLSDFPCDIVTVQ